MASNKSTEPRDTKSYLAEMPTASGEVVKVRLDDPTDEYISTLRQAGVKVTPIQKFTKPRYAKITPEVKHKLVWMIEQGHTYTYACEAVGVSVTYVNEYRQKHPQFDRRVKAAMQGHEDMMADALYTTGLGGNVTAQIFYLVNRTRFRPRSDPRKWMHVSSIEVSGPEGQPIQTMELTHEERKRIILSYEKRAERAESLPKISKFKKSMKNRKTPEGQ